jgi:hypothetical protein
MILSLVLARRQSLDYQGRSRTYPIHLYHRLSRFMYKHVFYAGRGTATERTRRDRPGPGQTGHTVHQRLHKEAPSRRYVRRSHQPKGVAVNSIADVGPASQQVFHAPRSPQPLVAY